ncbi:MAG: 4'-phosphopantetheinyl transferase superfamily protein [Bacteroidota bacterium]
MTRLVFPGGSVPSDLQALFATHPEADHALLSASERARCDGFGSPERRLQFTLGRTVARGLAGRRLGVAPAAVPLRVGADGAPEVDGMHLSIAHGGRGDAVVAAAAVADRPVGVDVEAIVPRRADLWPRILAPEEAPVFEALGVHGSEGLTLAWSLKEAVLKGQRTGLRAGARSVRLSLCDEGVPEVGLPEVGLPEAGAAAAVSERSGRWHLRWRRLGAVWVTLAWAAAQEKQTR